MQSLFSASITPLASLLRPESIDDLVGQSHLIGIGKPIRRFIEAGKLPSILLWGPPGCGKTSLARVIANSLDAEFFHLSGVLSKKDDVIKIVSKAQKNFHDGRQTILFLDEIHRWSKSQQDVLLPWVEKGIITLIGATTENPSFTVINALLSRCRTYILEKITEKEIVEFLEKNMERIQERYPCFNPLLKGGQGGLEKEKFHIPFRDDLKEKARELRKNMTGPEKEIWYNVLSRDNFLGFRFLRQKPLLDFIADFYCAELRLAIEIDGASHIGNREYDLQRTEKLESFGVTVIRFTNDEVLGNLEGVYQKLQEHVDQISSSHPPCPPSQKGVLELIAHLGGGDLRNTMNLLETACILQGEGALTRETILEAGSKSLIYDQDGEEHYNLISAMHKSLRDSDGDAAIYWIGRMLAGGEDPRYIVRRMINFASEDVGIGDPLAIIMANSVYDICEKMGMPECELPLCNLAYHLASAPRDNSIYMAMLAMHDDIDTHGSLPVPLHLRNAPTPLMREAGYGAGYEYAHDLPDKKSTQEHFPEELRGRRYRNSLQ